MKTLLAVAISAILVSACGGSDSDDPAPLEDMTTPAATAPGSVPDTGSGPLDVVDADTGTAETPDTGDDTTTEAPNTAPDTDTSSATADPAMADAADSTVTSGDSGGESPSAVAPPLDEASNELIGALAGYRADASVARVLALADTATGTALASRELPSTTLTDGNASGPTAVVEHDCALGGTLVTERTAIEISESNYSRDLRVDAFRFDECRLAETAGESVLDGDLVVTINGESGNRFSLAETRHRWSEFSLAGANGDGLEIDGGTAVLDDNSFNGLSTRTVSLPRYVETSGGNLVERLDDAVLSLAIGDQSEGLYSAYRLSLGGSVTNASSGGVPVAIETVTELSRLFGNEPELNDRAEPFVGELAFRSDDGRMLTVSARDTDTAELRVDRTYVAADGTVSVTENAPFVVLTTETPEDVAAN